MDKREGEVSRLSFENFLSHSAENFRRGTFYGVTDFGYRKILCLRGLCHDFSSNFFFSQDRKTLQVNPSVLCFGKFPVANKFVDEKWGYQNFPSKIFHLKVLKNFVGQPFRVSLIWGIDNFYASEGYVTIFCRNFLSHSAEKLCRWTILCCVSENFRQPSFWMRRGGVEIFRRNFFVSKCRKIS